MLHVHIQNTESRHTSLFNFPKGKQYIKIEDDEKYPDQKWIRFLSALYLKKRCAPSPIHVDTM